MRFNRSDLVYALVRDKAVRGDITAVDAVAPDLETRGIPTIHVMPDGRLSILAGGGMCAVKEAVGGFPPALTRAAVICGGQGVIQTWKGGEWSAAGELVVEHGTRVVVANAENVHQNGLEFVFNEDSLAWEALRFCGRAGGDDGAV